MQPITWQDFERVELRIGTIIAVEEFPEARKPAWKLRCTRPVLQLKKVWFLAAVSHWYAHCKPWKAS